MKKPTSSIGSMAYYREMDAYNSQLRGRLLARTKKKQNETAKQWLQRVSKTIKEKEIKTKG